MPAGICAAPRQSDGLVSELDEALGASKTNKQNTTIEVVVDRIQGRARHGAASWQSPLRRHCTLDRGPGGPSAIWDEDEPG